MNPVLVDSIRRRMREQTTEQLLELWVTNDRVMWSPEAFEAVKSLLAERGVKQLPAQNDPAPMAGTHSPAQDPVARYWLGWLRPVLWVCVAMFVASLPRTAMVVWALTVPRGGRSATLADVWRAAGTFEFWVGLIVVELVLPLLLGVGAIGALRLRRWSRIALLTYGVAAVVNGVAAWVLGLWQTRRYWDSATSFLTSTESVRSLAQSLILPVILWLLLRRPEIRTLFVPVMSGRAFEPLPAPDAMSNPTAP
jgi:hypothetical protein